MQLYKFLFLTVTISVILLSSPFFGKTYALLPSCFRALFTGGSSDKSGSFGPLSWRLVSWSSNSFSSSSRHTALLPSCFLQLFRSGSQGSSGSSGSSESSVSSGSSGWLGSSEPSRSVSEWSESSGPIRSSETSESYGTFLGLPVTIKHTRNSVISSNSYHRRTESQF